MPIEGEYSLNIFAREKGNPSCVHNVHSYLMQSDGHGISDEKADEIKSEIEEPKVIIETVETSEPEILIPAPTGYTNVVACFHRRHADDAREYSPSIGISKSNVQLPFLFEGLTTMCFLALGSLLCISQTSSTSFLALNVTDALPSLVTKDPPG
jgi:hypothetical protein